MPFFIGENLVFDSRARCDSGRYQLSHSKEMRMARKAKKATKKTRRKTKRKSSPGVLASAMKTVRRQARKIGL
jgi:hypothetical protein